MITLLVWLYGALFALWLFVKVLAAFAERPIRILYTAIVLAGFLVWAFHAAYS